MKKTADMTKAELVDRVATLERLLNMSHEWHSHRAHSTNEKDQRCWRMNVDRGDMRGVGFDEIVVGDWLHIEQMDGGNREPSFWGRLGSICVWFHIKRGELVLTYAEMRGEPYMTTRKADGFVVHGPNGEESNE